MVFLDHTSLEGLFFAAWARLLIKMLESALVIGWVRGVPRWRLARRRLVHERFCAGNTSGERC
jgi:hypothetical protein